MSIMRAFSKSWQKNREDREEAAFISLLFCFFFFIFDCILNFFSYYFGIGGLGDRDSANSGCGSDLSIAKRENSGCFINRQRVR